MPLFNLRQRGEALGGLGKRFPVLRGAFVRTPEQIAANAAIPKRFAEIDKTLLQHDSALRDLYDKLLSVLQPPPTPRKRRSGSGSVTNTPATSRGCGTGLIR